MGDLEPSPVEGRGVDGEAGDFSGDDGEAGVDAVFFGEVGEESESEADAEGGFAGVDVGFDGVGEAGFLEDGDGVFEGADAGDDQAGGGLDLLRGGDDLRAVAEAFEGFLDAAEVGHAVVDDCEQVGGSENGNMGGTPMPRIKSPGFPSGAPGITEVTWEIGRLIYHLPLLVTTMSTRRLRARFLVLLGSLAAKEAMYMCFSETPLEAR